MIFRPSVYGIWILEFLTCATGASVIPTQCQEAWDAMMNDVNYQHWRNQSEQFCYIRYQNRLAFGDSTPVSCEHWEYESFCSSTLSGRVCHLETGFVRISKCVPSSCPDESLPDLVGAYFNPTTSILDCSVSISARTPVIAAIVSTVVILSITAFAVFLLRPPRAVRETAKLSRAQTHLLTISEGGSSTKLN